jgi:alpha-galactosidase
MSPETLRIAYIGGGSRGWARKLMMDLALCPELSGEVLLYDIDPQAARLNARLAEWIQGRPGALSRWRYRAVATLEKALAGADFVVLSIQPGSLEVMAEEIAIAEEFGLYFPVGDTTGAPGLVRGLRSAAIYSGFARAIAEACPKAWVINYTNPMSICTRALIRTAPSLKVFGCCHEVFSTQKMLARLAGEYLRLEPPRREEVNVNVLGINHFTWVDRAAWQGHDLLELLRKHIARPGVLRDYTQAEVEGWNDWFHCEDQVKFSLFMRFGILPAAGDRHLVEFLPGFILSPETLFRWGIIRTPVSWRIERWKASPQRTRDLMEGRAPFELEASGEQGVGMIKALVGLGELVSNVNLENQGQVANLPPGCVVETNAHFSRDQVRPLAAGRLPAGLAALVALHVANQELIVEAALTRDRDLAFQAVLNDPASALPVDRAWAMFDRMMMAGRAHLPGWKWN